jgi:GNAT superfamily N-acetyltransferase
VIISRETWGLQLVYRLRDDELDEAIGEAVLSEGDDGFRLHGIFVKPRFRGKGYGKFIMKAVLKETRNKRVTLCTGFGNIAFFKRFGFRVTNTSDSLVFMERDSSTYKT